MPPKFVELWLRTVVEFMPTPPKFSHWETASLTAWTLYYEVHAVRLAVHVIYITRAKICLLTLIL